MSFGSLLDAIPRQRILVVGDVMLDEYIIGEATRISPEAPVMVVRQKQTTQLPGGAANVAKNILAFGARAHLIGVKGDDDGGVNLTASLHAANLESDLIEVPDRCTTRKTRVLADSRHQVLRIDWEDDGDIPEGATNQLLEQVETRLQEADAIVLSDYRKGCLTERTARVIHQLAKAHWKPLIVNPKPASIEFYRGATVISLNRLEASQACGFSVTPDNALEAASSLRDRHRAEAVVVTLGDRGMVVAGPESFRIPATRVEVADPAGAGDTVIATIALGVAAIGFDEKVFRLASKAAAYVVRHVGVATVTPEDIETLRLEQ